MNGLLRNSFRSSIEFDNPMYRDSEGSGDPVDEVARAAAEQAQLNIDAITAQPNEVIPDGALVYTPEGIYENKTGADVTLNGDDPQTVASLESVGLIPYESNGSGTNYSIPLGIFADDEVPVLATAKAWYEAIAEDSRSTGDVVFYNSPEGVSVTYAVGDGDGGTDTFSQVSYYAPQKPALTVEHINTIIPLVEGTRYYVDASALTPDGQTTDILGAPLDYVEYALPNGTDTESQIEFIGKGSPFVGIALNGAFNGDTQGVINASDRLVTLNWTGSYWAWGKG